MRHGAVQQHVNPSDLMRLKIIFTNNLEIVSIFNEIVSPLFIKIGVNNLEIQILSNIRDVLLPKLILGKLKISNVEEINNQTKINA
jgi:type I restriction enzyme S subunit